MTIGKLKDLIKDIPDDTEVLVDTEAATFNCHMVNIRDICYENKISNPHHVAIILDYNCMEFKNEKEIGS
jgi:hypothetical protein